MKTRLDPAKADNRMLWQLSSDLQGILAILTMPLESEPAWLQLTSSAQAFLAHFGLPTPEGGWDKYEGPECALRLTSRENTPRQQKRKRPTRGHRR
jgi:hypothetical protein